MKWIVLATAFSPLASGALACAVPVASCDVGHDQTAVLYDTDHGNIMFSQYSRVASPFTQTFVLVDCRSRSAVALGDKIDDLSRHQKGRLAMQDALRTAERPKLGKLYRDLKRLGLRTKRFKLRTSHCGCDLPRMDPPPANCPDHIE